MKTVLLAAGGRSELAPLTEFTAAALLPVADKPLLIHALESLTSAGLNEVIVVVGAFGGEVRQALGDGAQWGMRLEYVSAQCGRSVDDQLHQLGAELNQDYLLVQGEFLRTPIIADFLARAALVKNSTVIATIKGAPAGVSLVRRSTRTSLAVLGYHALRYIGKDGMLIDFPDARLSLIESVRALHRANLDAIQGNYPGLVISGREAMPAVRVGRKSRLPVRAVKGAPVFIGERCRIAANAELMSETVVSSDSVIDRFVTLHRAVVLPHTYIGAMLEVRNAVVAGDWLIDLDSGAYTRVTESFLLSSIDNRNVAAIVRDSASRVAARIRAALLPASPSSTATQPTAQLASPTNGQPASSRGRRRFDPDPAVRDMSQVDRAAGA